MKRLRYVVIIVVLGCCAALVLAETGSQAQQFQEAIHVMETKGDYPAAIRLFEQVVKGSDRNLAARSLLYVGLCYEKLGKREAQRAYRRLIREFADQRDVVAQARARLAALEESERSTDRKDIMVRRVWQGALDIEGTPTPDGRYLTFVDWKTGDLAIRDLKTGENRRLTNEGYPAYALLSLVSPDGQQIAYTWVNKDDVPELRIVGIDGSKPRLVFKNVHKEVNYLEPYGWTPDGKHILTSFWKKDRTNQIVLVSAKDGSVQVIKTLDWRHPFRMSLSPDGRYIAYDFPPKEDDLARDIFLLASDGSREISLIQHPANDLHPIWTPDGHRVLFTSDRGGTVGVWAVQVKDGKHVGAPELIKRHLANTFWPMGFTQKGSLFFAQDNGGGDIYVAKLDPTAGKVEGSPTRIIQSYLGLNTSPAWSPDGQSLAYLSRRRAISLGHSATLVIHDFKTGEEREFSLNLHRKHSRPRWSPNGGAILCVDRNHNLLMLRVENGEVTRMVRSDETVRVSFTSWFPDGKAIFYVLWRREGENKIRRSIMRRDLKSGEEKEIYHFKLKGTFKRWALSPDGRQLAFAGNSEDGDMRLMVVPVDGGEPRELLKVQKPEVIFADVGLAWTLDGKYILFGRGKPGDWPVPDYVELWRISTEGGQPEKLGLEMDELRHLSVHPDGRSILFAAGPESENEVWVMENILPGLEAAK